jgi:threonyl-tRNA synthetase
MGSTMISILKIKITEADFKKIEDSILEISRGKHEFKLRPVSKADALELYKDNVYKTEMITNLEDGTITFCDHDTFTDLCRGGHIEYRYYQSSKIMSVAGAYWRGDEKNKQQHVFMELHFQNKRFNRILAFT